MSTVKIILYGWLAFIIVGVLTGGSATIGGIAMIITWYVLFKNKKDSQTETENDDSPPKGVALPSYIEYATIHEAKEQNGDKSSFSDAFNRNYYLVVERSRCDYCDLPAWIPVGTYYGARDVKPRCTGNEFGWHSFSPVDYTKEGDSKKYVEIIKTDSTEYKPGYVYFNGHWWKPKSDKWFSQLPDPDYPDYHRCIIETEYLDRPEKHSDE